MRICSCKIYEKEGAVLPSGLAALLTLWSILFVYEQCRSQSNLIYRLSPCVIRHIRSFQTFPLCFSFPSLRDSKKSSQKWTTRIVNILVRQSVDAPMIFHTGGSVITGNYKKTRLRETNEDTCHLLMIRAFAQEKPLHVRQLTPLASLAVFLR